MPQSQPTQARPRSPRRWISRLAKIAPIVQMLVALARLVIELKR